MKENLVDWFLNRQLKILLFLGCPSVALVFFFNHQAFQILFSFLFSLLLVFAGRRLYTFESAENWVRFSHSEILKSIIGGVLMIFGWLTFFQDVFALAAAAVILKFNN